MIQWDNEFSVNNDAIDNEHQSLFTALNDFYEGLRQNASRESMGKLIDNLVFYTKTHFANEEIYMQKIGFPGIENHLNEHREFISKVEAFQSKIKEGKLLVSVEVTNFIKNWITNHIKTQDKQYAAFVAQK